VGVPRWRGARIFLEEIRKGDTMTTSAEQNSPQGGSDIQGRTRQMHDRWLVCGVDKGMFSDEMAVEYRDRSYFILKRFIETMQAGQAKVRVRVFDQSGRTWAVLPTEDSATIAVEQKDLVPA
jgi:hypothetical protein